jgi:hydrogenase maturation protease
MKSEKTDIYTNPETGRKPLLLIGVGNDSRADDGLGWAFLDRVKETFPDGKLPLNPGAEPVPFDIEYRYQLQVEDAAMICQYRNVVFIDATEEVHDEGFAIRECESSGTYHFSSHIQGPESILYLSEVLFGRSPETFIVSISGYEWELGIGMCERAAENLERAFNTFLDRQLKPEHNVNEKK